MLEEIRQGRIEKIRKLEQAGMEPYPIESRRDFSLAEAVSDFAKLSKRKTPLYLAGRILAVREHGGSVFCDFTDGSTSLTTGGSTSLTTGGLAKLQAYLKKDRLGEEMFSLFRETVDIGDFLEFQGKLFLTKKKEKTIEVKEWRMLAKSLRPLPEKWHGLQDIEERFRKRYLDILMNEKVKERFLIRSQIITEIRKFLDKEGCLEVETPMFQPIAGGASAAPFITHHNALDIDLYLRIAPELYLKRLLIAGFPKVYEMGRNFRNEGIDINHNPEFTMLEFYQAYWGSPALMDFVEKFMSNLVKKILGKKGLEYQGEKIYFNKKFKTVSFYDLLERSALMPGAEKISREEMALKAKQFGLEVLQGEGKEKISDNIFKKICCPKIIQPTFVINHPLVVSPLAKKLKGSDNLADRFQLIVGGLELVNGFSELNNPLEQRERFMAQEKARQEGDIEASRLDESFLEALEYGMPPAAGMGLGLDRLVMLLTNTRNIKEVIIFPTMKPK